MGEGAALLEARTLDGATLLEARTLEGAAELTRVELAGAADEARVELAGVVEPPHPKAMLLSCQSTVVDEKPDQTKPLTALALAPENDERGTVMV